jgi:hypothetical protein
MNSKSDMAVHTGKPRLTVLALDCVALAVGIHYPGGAAIPPDNYRRTLFRCGASRLRSMLTARRIKARAGPRNHFGRWLRELFPRSR